MSYTTITGFSPAGQVRFSAAAQPKKTPQQVMFGGGSEEPAQGEGSASQQSAGKGVFGKIAGKLHWAALIAAFGGLLTANGLISNNKAGEHSLVFDHLAGGFIQEAPHDAGPVWLGPKGLIGFRENVPVHTTEHSVRECVEPNTQDNKKMPPLCLRINFKLPKENLFTLYTQKLGDHRETVKLDPAETQFLRQGDPIAEKLYVQMIRNPVRGAVNALTPTVRGDRFYYIAPLVDQGFDRGIPKMTVQKLEGGTREFTMASLQEQVGPLIEITDVAVEDLDVTPDLIAKFEERAQRPLQGQIAVLRGQYGEIAARRNDAQEEVNTVHREETATWDGKILALAETGQIKVQEINAEKMRVSTEGEQAKLIIMRDADRESAEIRARGDRESSRIVSEANQEAEQMIAEAQALVVRAQGLAEADAAKLKGEPYQEFGELVLVDALRRNADVMKALGESGIVIRFIDDEIGKKFDFLNITSGSGQNDSPVTADGITSFIAGSRAAGRMGNSEQGTEVTPPPVSPEGGQRDR